jgi:arsenate reductase (glutaredoxin)
MTGGDPITIYHNPHCGKSRGALAIIAENGIEPAIIEYLKAPPAKEELRAILKKLGMKAEQIVRKGEPVFKEMFSGKSLTDDQWLDALVKNPILIERPIVVRGAKAIIGRPPEKVRELL